MEIPERFRLPAVSADIVDEMLTLCGDIESELEAGGTADEFLKRWHAHAGRPFEPHEFRNYWRWTSKEEFVRSALVSAPTFVRDLNYSEARSVLEAVSTASLSESDTGYFLTWLECQFPGSGIGNLIYWPDVWFGDASLFREADGAFKPDCALSKDQILAYAMARSGRQLADAPSGILMPYPLPAATRP